MFQCEQTQKHKISLSPDIQIPISIPYQLSMTGIFISECQIQLTYMAYINNFGAWKKSGLIMGVTYAALDIKRKSPWENIASCLTRQKDIPVLNNNLHHWYLPQRENINPILKYNAALRFWFYNSKNVLSIETRKALFTHCESQNSIMELSNNWH